MTQHLPDDDLLAAAIRDSVGGRVASAATDAIERAAAASAAGRITGPVIADWRALARVDRIRLVALCAAMAMLVNRAMARLGPTDPYSGVLPWIVLASCVATAVLVPPLAKRWERRER